MKHSKRNRTSEVAVGEQLDAFKIAQSSNAPKREHKPFVPGPNPDLPGFIARHSTPYDPEHDDYDVTAFDHDLEVYKHNKLYSMHIYWSKKDPVAITEYIKHYTKPGDIVLDPFCGSGTTGCAAISVSRYPVLVDVSSSAAFLAYHYCLFPESEQAKTAINALLQSEESREIDDLYSTRCDRCGGQAITEFAIWSDTFQCPGCATIVPLFDCPEVYVSFPDGEKKKKRVCPSCLKKYSGIAKREFVISTRSKKFQPKLVATKYVCLGNCRPKGKIRRHNDSTSKAQEFFRRYDLAAAERVGTEEISTWYPKRRMMDVPAERKVWGVKWRAGTANFEEVSGLFTPRNLYGLALLRKVANSDHPFTEVSPLLYLTWIVHKCSNLMGCGSDGVGRISVGTYYIPPIRLEARPTKYLAQAKTQIVGHFEAKSTLAYDGEFIISAEANRTAFQRIPADSMDYIFTDPPYLNIEVQYGELNFLWDAWLDLPNSLAEEITLNPIHSHPWEQAEDALRYSIAEMYRVLKPSRWASICYHDTSEANWAMLQRAVLDAGFEIHTVTCLDPRSKSRKAITSEKIVKTDLVLNCRKPRNGETNSREVHQRELLRVSSRVKDIIIEHLIIKGGQTRDKLWDVVLKRLLSRGQMAAHRFDDLLSEVAFRSESGRWFLRDEFESLSQSDIKNEEAAGDALLRFARLRCTGVPAKFAAQMALSNFRFAPGDINEGEIEIFIKNSFIHSAEAEKKFKLGARMKGIEFYDCLFFYLTHFLKGRSAGKTPKRNLADFLEEYLVRFRHGDKWLYRVPDDVEAASLRKARQTGLGRRIRQFVSFLKGEGDFPTEKMPDAKTLVAWMKHCATFGLAEEGVLLFDRGGLAGQLIQLSEDDRYDAQDYYAQCRRKAGKAKAEDNTDMDDEDVDDEAGEVDEE